MPFIKTKTALYPGTFDPITYGHVALIERAVTLFSDVLIAIPEFSTKTPCFTTKERVELVSQALQPLGDAVRVITFDTTLAAFAATQQAPILIRGLRGADDFNYEWRLAGMNQALDATLETIFLAAHPSLSHISASLVREIAALHGAVDAFVPPVVADALRLKFA